MARKRNDWSMSGKVDIPPVVKAVAVVLGAFLVTGLLYLAAQQAMTVASRRVETRYAPRYSGYDDKGESLPPTFAAPLNGSRRYGVANASGSSAQSGITRFAQAVPTTPQVTSLPAPGDPFTNDGERQTARTRVKGLRDTLTTLRRYDNASLWAGVSLIDQARKAESDAILAQANPGVTLSEGDGTPDKYATADEAAAVRVGMGRKILGELEAMNGEVGLSAHPGRFPEPLHSGAEAVGTAMRTYLETARMAVARPHEGSVLKTRAGRELARVEELIRALETPRFGGASAAN